MRKAIQGHEQAIENRTGKIERYRKEIKEKEVIIHDLEEENKDSELIISAYQAFVEQSMREADQQSMESDSMRELVADDKNE